MQRKLLLLTTFLFSGVIVVFSQQITGKITTPEDVNGLPGVNVLKKGTTIGAVTDIDGKFTINATKDDTLVISFVGLETKEVAVGAQTFIAVELQQQAKVLSDVVVTALGIKRSEKALGYSVQKVSGEDIAKVKELDVINALSGKVAGVNITQAGGGIGGGGSRIVIRGESSLAGNNDPLYIINGIAGDANDVAPDDIESISVLKGSAAAALYGSKAGAGVILITTKSGKGSKDLQIELNSNYTVQTPLVLPEYQNTFGQGKNSLYSYVDGNNKGEWDDEKVCWGPAFDGKLRAQFTGIKPWVAYPDNVKDFYQLGHIAVNNFSVAKATENTSARFSYSNTDQKGITPNTGLTKNQFDLNSTFIAFKKLTLTANLSYIRTDCPNDRTEDPRFLPRNIDINALKNYWVPGMEGTQQMNYRRSDNNLYFVAYEQPKGYIDNRTISNFSANYEIIQDLNIMGRYGIVYNNHDYFEKKAKSSYSGDGKEKNGFYKKGIENKIENTAEFLISYNKKLGSAITSKLSFGGSHYRFERDQECAQIYELTFTDIYNINNRSQAATFPSWENGIWKIERNGLYAFLNLDYKSKIFLDVTGRNDWSSTLPKNSNSFFYPSVALSGLVNELITLPSFFSFWKLRASWAQVGKDIPNAYFTGTTKYNWIDNSTNGTTDVTTSNILYSENIKPELTTGIEFGSDMRFLNNRLGFDFTYYISKTVDQILKEQVSASTSYSYMMINAGQISSKGVEITINAIPVRTKSFEWKTQLNWSMDRTYVDELIDSLPTFSKSQSVNNFLTVRDVVGQRRGTLYGQGYLRTVDGQQLFSYSGDTRHTSGVIALGNYNPDWIASLSNTFTYNNLSFSCLLDYHYGGILYNQTQRLLNFYGLSAATAYNNRVGIVPDGVVEDGNGGYRKLTLEDMQKYGVNGLSGDQYWANMSDEGIPENAIVDATYLKLREARIAYDLPAKLVSKTFVKTVTVSVVGRNLAVWTKVKHIDPETFGYSSENSDFGWASKIPGFDSNGIPSVRNFGFNVNVKF